jgi:hypothetical protein
MEPFKSDIKELREMLEEHFSKTEEKTKYVSTQLKEIKSDIAFLNCQSEWLVAKLKHIQFIHKEKHNMDCHYQFQSIENEIGPRTAFVVRILIEETLDSLARIKTGLKVDIFLRNELNFYKLQIQSEGLKEELQKLESIHLAESRVIKVCKLFGVEPIVRYDKKIGQIIFDYRIDEI